MILCVEEASCRFQYFFFFICNEPNGSLLQSNTALWHWPLPPQTTPLFWEEELPGVFTLVAGVLLHSSLERPDKKKKNCIKMTTKMFDQCVVSVYSCTVLPTLRRRSNMCISPSRSSRAPPPSISRICCVFEEGIDIEWGVGFFWSVGGRGRRVLVIIIMIIKYWLLYLIEQKQQWYFLMMNLKGFWFSAVWYVSVLVMPFVTEYGPPGLMFHANDSEKTSNKNE